MIGEIAQEVECIKSPIFKRDERGIAENEIQRGTPRILRGDEKGELQGYSDFFG
jgi:hypothetical protein